MKTSPLSLLAVLAFFAGVTPGFSAEVGKILEETGTSGGLVVQVGCEDADLAVDLANRGDAYLVHALDRDAAKVNAVRSRLRDAAVYGRASADHWSGDELPYADDLVNLLICSGDAAVSRDEILRVLVPEGAAWVGPAADGTWEKINKPRPENMDEWSHYLHGPDNNPVATDTRIGPPDRIQWMATPKFSRAHEQQASFSACVSAGGRMYYVLDDAPRVDIRLPSQWFLIARDAFNGVELWRRPMGDWVNQFRRFRAGPASLPFRLVADGDKVFVTLDFTGPVHVLDGASGETIRVIEGSEKAKQLIYEKGILTILVDEDVDRHDEIDEARRRGEFIKHRCRILKVHVESGETVWKREIDDLVFPCMALKNGRVYAQTTKEVFALDYESGATSWSADFEAQLPVSAGKLKNGEMQWESPSLVVNDQVVFAADFKKVHAYGAGDGQLKWQGASRNEYNAPPDMLLVGEDLWMRGAKGGRAALDPMTGSVRKEVALPKPYMHPRCYRGTAAGNYMMFGEMGVQMIDATSGDVRENDWIRGTCQYGVMPANGLLYVPPDSCACNMKTKLSGLYAFSSTRPGSGETVKTAEPSHPLEKGPAFNKIKSQKSRISNPSDWPTYRATPARNGIVATSISTKSIAETWSLSLRAPLSSPIAANGVVYVAEIDRHTVNAVDAESGALLWKFVAGGRIDSPPTVFGNGVYFGSADGWVYALNAGNGEMAWRFRAAPRDRLIGIRGQLESAWPVHGSVLVSDGVLTCSAGRSSYLDGGIHLHRLDPATGEVRQSTVVFSPDLETGKQPEPTTENRRDVRGLLSDVLLDDGEDIYMRQAKLDLETGDERGAGVHLFSPLGFLDDTWWHRAYWIVNDEFTSHWSGWWKVGNQVASGRILSYNGDEVFGFGRDKYPGGNTGQWRGGERYQLFAFDRAVVPPKEVIDRKGRKAKTPPGSEMTYRWNRDVPLLATALAVTEGAVFIAGPPDEFSTAISEGEEALELEDVESALAAWRGEKGGVLFAADLGKGSELARLELSAPTVFDGMAAADGRLLLSLADGSLVCLAGE